MSTPPAPDEPLQFHEADYGAESPVGLACATCAAPIHDLYYEASGQVLCEPCRDRIEASYYGGSGIARFAKASIFGAFAAALGAVLYYIIVRATDYNIGLVAIVVGLMVGSAVRSGSGARGGWVYQLLALFLTYSAIAGMLAPLVFADIVARQEQEDQQQAEDFEARLKVLADEAKRKAAEEEAKAQTEAAAGKVAEAESKPPEPGPESAPPAPAPADAPEAEPPPAADAPKPAPEAEAAGGEEVLELDLEDDVPPTTGEIALMIVMMAVVSYSFPVLIAMGSPMSGLIYGFALWEAWKINRRSVLSFNGPYHVLPPDAILPDDGEHDGGRGHES